MSDRVRWGVLGNANIARVCVIPAIQKSRNGRVHALATRSPEQSREVRETFGIPRVYQGTSTTALEFLPFLFSQDTCYRRLSLFYIEEELGHQ